MPGLRPVATELAWAEGIRYTTTFLISDGVMYSLVKTNVPFILAGSIRDDGPLPDTITDAIQAQEAMREHAKTATMVIMIATALHAIGFGNMLPAYATTAKGIRPLTTIAVDSSAR